MSLRPPGKYGRRLLTCAVFLGSSAVLLEATAAAEKPPRPAMVSAIAPVNGVGMATKSDAIREFVAPEVGSIDADLDNLSRLCTTLALTKMSLSGLSNSTPAGIEIIRGDITVRISDRLVHSLCVRANSLPELAKRDRTLTEHRYVKVRIGDTAGVRG